MTVPLLHRPADAAELLGISLSRVYQLIASGDIATVRIGGGSRAAHRIERVEIERFIGRNRLVSSNAEACPVRQDKTKEN